MKVKLIGKIGKDGKFTCDTIKGAGPDCKKIADLFAGSVGGIDESSRGDTEDLHEQVEGNQDLHVGQ